MLVFMHMNAVWQSLNVCATKNFCAVITFTEIFAPLFYSHVELPITLQTLMIFAIYQDET